MKTILIVLIIVLFPLFGKIKAQITIRCENNKLTLEGLDAARGQERPRLTYHPSCGNPINYRLEANNRELDSVDPQLPADEAVTLVVKNGGNTMATFQLRRTGAGANAQWQSPENPGLSLLSGYNTLRDALEMARHWQNREYNYVSAYLQKYEIEPADWPNIQFLAAYCQRLVRHVTLGNVDKPSWAKAHGGTDAGPSSTSPSSC